MKNKGFTLIEMMVAVSLFTVVMLVSVGSLLALIDASKRAQGIQSVMNNLNVALDGMVRALRMGQKYEVSNGVTSYHSLLLARTLVIQMSDGHTHL